MPSFSEPSPGDRHRKEPGFEVERARLLALLDEGTRGRLSLVLGPSGSGKSVLVRQWARNQDPGTVATLTVDVETNDAESFGRELVRAVADVRPGFGEEAVRHVELSGERLGQPFLEALLKEISSVVAKAGPLTVVIDDLHQLPCAVTEELAWLVMRTPDEFHLVVATRTEPPMRLARLRAHGQLMEIRAPTLALDGHEVGELAEHVAGRPLTTEQRGRLVERTEGWAVGVQLAALALRDQAIDVDDYLAAFNGANREVADYLIDEVVRHQSPELRSFLWTTSVLDRLDIDLCNLLTGRDDAGEILIELQRRELFVVPLDSASNCCRYHHLFADVLRRQLRSQDRVLHDDLLTRAARWHLDRDELPHGVEYLLRAERWEEALNLIGANGWELYERGETALGIRWLKAVPKAVLRRHGQAEFTLLSLYRIAGNTTASSALLNELEEDRPPGSRGAMGVSVLRAMGVKQDVPPDVALAGAEYGVAWFAGDNEPHRTRPSEPTDQWVLSCARIYGARALLHLGRLTEAREWLQVALELSAPYRNWKIRALGGLGLVEVVEGNLEQAYVVSQQALKLDAEARGADPISAADAQFALGIVAYERDELEAAESAIGEAESLARVNNSTNMLASVVAWRARLALAVGEPRRGMELLARWRREGNPPEPSDVTARIAATEAQLLLSLNEVPRAKRVLAQAAHTPETLAVAAQLAARDRDWKTLALVMDRWPSSPSRRSRIEHLLWRGVLARSRDDEVGVATAVGSAVRLAEIEGHRRVFMDGGPLVIEVVRSTDVLANAASLGELADVLSDPDWREPTQRGEGLLSERELVVLAQLGTLLSNQEIAEKLMISQNTLKTHLRRIYRKLGAKSRREALARAIELGLHTTGPS